MLSNEPVSISIPKQYAWKPKPDITAYELALCLPILSLRYSVEFAIASLPKEAQRHFEEIK